MASTNLSTKRERDRLPAQAEPHWQKLARGAYLGLYVGKNGSTWRGRYRTPDGKQVRTDHFADAADFDAAKLAAEQWFAQLGATGVRSVTTGSVRDALDCYIAKLRADGARSAESSERAFASCIHGDALESKPLGRVLREDVIAWRGRLVERATLSVNSINTYVARVLAGVRYAMAEGGFVGTPAAWDIKRLPKGKAKLAVFLSDEQRAAIIAHATPEFAALLRGCYYTGARPGEIAKATVADLDIKRGTLRLSDMKAGDEPRVRDVVLDRFGLAFFKAQRAAAVLARTSLLCPQANGKAFGREGNDVALAFRTAVAAYHDTLRPDQLDERIPDGGRAYCYRHARISELLQLGDVDVLTVAKQCGTSPEQIFETYYKFIPDVLDVKLEKIAKSI